MAASLQDQLFGHLITLVWVPHCFPPASSLLSKDWSLPSPGKAVSQLIMVTNTTHSILGFFLTEVDRSCVRR